MIVPPLSLRTTRMLTAGAAATVVLAAGCGTGTPARAHKHATASAFAVLTRRQACERLRAGLARHGGALDVATLRYVADHAPIPRLAADARMAVRDLEHTGIAPLALVLLQDECAKAGVRLRVP